MLQQTQVARVVPRWTTWLERWPTVEALAAAPRSEVIRAWQGLGYNRRAVNLHRAAIEVARARLAGRPDGAARGRPLHGRCGGQPRLRPAGAARGRERAARAGAERPRVRPRVRARRSWASARRSASPACRAAASARWQRSARRAAGVSRPTRKQAPYEGSFRQRRAATLRLVSRARPRRGAELDDEAVAALARDGLVELHDGLVRLAE